MSLVCIGYFRCVQNMPQYRQVDTVYLLWPATHECVGYEVNSDVDHVELTTVAVSFQAFCNAHGLAHHRHSSHACQR